SSPYSISPSLVDFYVNKFIRLKPVFYHISHHKPGEKLEKHKNSPVKSSHDTPVFFKKSLLLTVKFCT
ncbi:MAG: hypothetical protein RMI51_03325, partial [Aquificaceae bacterium]|nr:hypothetical protein [Aquificaceae bacterium]